MRSRRIILSCAAAVALWSGVTLAQARLDEAATAFRVLLASPGDAQISPEQRYEAIQAFLPVAHQVLPATQSPRELMALATSLITYGAEPEAGVVEHWGEGSRGQTRIRPIAAALVQALDLAATRARQEAEHAAEAMGAAPTPQQQREYTELDNLAANARYSRAMAEYYRVLGLDAADPARAAMAKGAMIALGEYDTPDSGVQPQVRLRIARLQIAAGDRTQARQTLATLLDRKTQPLPPVAVLEEASGCLAVCALLDRNEPMAAEVIRQLSDRKGDAVLPAILQYRLQMLRVELAQSETQKREARSRAVAVVQSLAKNRPDLRPRLFELLARSIDPAAPVTSLDVFSLKALIQQGMVEASRPQRQILDRSTLERAVGACRELISRKGNAEVNATALDDAGVALPQLLERLGDDPAAAVAYLAYVEQSTHAANRSAALNNCLAAIGRVSQKDAQTADGLLERALPVAVMQLHRRDLAVEYGQRLLRQGQYARAGEAFGRVRPEDRGYLDARLGALQSAAAAAAADAANTASQRPTRAELFTLANELAAMAQREAHPHVELLARLVAARFSADAKPALDHLQAAEKLLRPGPDLAELNAELLSLRVRWLLEAGHADEASTVLLVLLKSRDGEQGAALIRPVLSLLDADLAASRSAKDLATQARLAQAKAVLARTLVDWTSQNSEAAVRKQAYSYRLYSASAQRDAALAQPDPTARLASLRQTLEACNSLLDERGLQLWREGAQPSPEEARYGDVAALFLKAQILFDLGDYAQAGPRLARLLQDRKLGGPWVDGKENALYWEATCKLYKSNVEVAKRSGNTQLRDETAQGLKRLYIREGSAIGGDAWRAEFDKLRRDLLPEVSSPQPASAP